MILSEHSSGYIEAGVAEEDALGWPSKDLTTVALERLSTQQFDRFRDFIYRHSGIHIDRNKVTLLSNRVRRRVRAGGHPDFDAYYQFLTSAAGRTELKGFLDAVTTNETFFFRTPNHYEWLVNQWIGEQLSLEQQGQRDRELKVWSAACSNGAELYSIAICLAENRFRLRDWTFNLLGTDLSDEMIQSAREGRFRARAMESVSPERRKRHFRYDTESDLWQVRGAVREGVDFRRHNLLSPNGRSEFDCVFLCNVLIYFDQSSKERVVAHLINALRPGGYLVLGPSEGIYDLLGKMDRVTPLVYRKGTTGRDGQGTRSDGGLGRSKIVGSAISRGPQR